MPAEGQGSSHVTPSRPDRIPGVKSTGSSQQHVSTCEHAIPGEEHGARASPSNDARQYLVLTQLWSEVGKRHPNGQLAASRWL